MVSDVNENAGAPKKAARLTGALLARKGMATPAGFVRVATESPHPTAAIPEAGGAEGGESRAAPVLAVDGGQATLALGDEGEQETGPTEATNTAVDGDWASLSDISIGPRFREAAAQAAAARSGSVVAEQPGKSGVGDAAATDGRAAAPAAANDRGKQAAARAAGEALDSGVKAGQRAEPVLRGAAAKATPVGPPPIPARDPRPAGGGMRPEEGWAPARRVSPELADPRPRRAAPAMSTRPRKPRRRRRALPGFVSVLALAVFLLVSWTVYQIGQGDPGADAQDSGSSGLRASAEELGFAVSQMFAAITGRLDETPGPETGDEAEAASQGFIAESDVDPAPIEPELAASELEEPGLNEVGLGESGPDEVGPVLVVEPEDAGLAAGDSVADSEIAPGVDGAGDVDTAGAEAAPAIQTVASIDGVDGPESAQLLTPGDVAQGLPSAADVEPAAVLEPAEEGVVEVAVAPASGPAVEEAAETALVEAEAEVTDAVAAEAVAAEAVLAEAVAVEAETGQSPQGPQSLLRVPVPKPDVLARAGSATSEAAAGAEAAEEAPAEVVAAVDVSVPGYAVQLSSLRDEAAARREWARLSEELADVLGTTELTVEAGTVSARGTFFRVLTTRFAEQSDARAICESIQGLGQDCLVVRQR